MMFFEIKQGRMFTSGTVREKHLVLVKMRPCALQKMIYFNYKIHSYNSFFI